MIQEKIKDLLEKNILHEDQTQKLQAIYSGNLVSVYYELRLILYLGVILLTAGVGIIIYLNIGSIGHILSILGLFVATLACFVFAFLKGKPFSESKVEHTLPYLDYIVLLGALLLVAALGYVQFQFELLNNYLGVSSLFSAIIFFFIAYRFDHIGVLSLGITALAAFFGISTSPVAWHSYDFFTAAPLVNVSIVFGLALIALAFFLNKYEIKSHFTFTYYHFGLLLIFIASLSGLFSKDNEVIYTLVVYAGVVLGIYLSRQTNSMLLLVYAVLTAYVVTTYWISELDWNNEIWYLYFMLSCGGLVYFIISARKFFKRKA
jgi:hypothetical protein